MINNQVARFGTHGGCSRNTTPRGPSVTPTPHSRERPVDDSLTDREREVLELIAAGLSNREIAARMYVATSTIKSYTNSIFRRLGVSSRTQAVAEARALNLLPTSLAVAQPKVAPNARPSR
jgi:ATP/maltotriose-dependent transcriptional regulator MalT